MLIPQNQCMTKFLWSYKLFTSLLAPKSHSPVNYYFLRKILAVLLYVQLLWANFYFVIPQSSSSSKPHSITSMVTIFKSFMGCSAVSLVNDKSCSGRGDCLNGTCLCEIRFSGEDCTTFNIPFYAGKWQIFKILILGNVR